MDILPHRATAKERRCDIGEREIAQWEVEPGPYLAAIAIDIIVQTMRQEAGESVAPAWACRAQKERQGSFLASLVDQGGVDGDNRVLVYGSQFQVSCAQNSREKGWKVARKLSRIRLHAGSGPGRRIKIETAFSFLTWCE